MLRFCHENQKAQKYLMGGIEKTIETFKDTLLAKTGGILKAFFDHDILDEEVIIEWGKKVRNIQLFLWQVWILRYKYKIMYVSKCEPLKLAFSHFCKGGSILKSFGSLRSLNFESKLSRRGFFQKTNEWIHFY